MLNIDAVKNARTNGKSTKKNGVRVTENVLARAEENPTQACISVRGLDAHRGEIAVSLDGATYRLNKTDTHAAWATKQEECLEDFVALFNTLAETPNKIRGEVTAD